MFIDLRDTQVTDLTPLMNLPLLNHVNVGNTPVSAEQIAKLKKALPKCRIYGKPKPR